jgi:hypothetical protein
MPTEAETALTFDQWGERLNAIYLRVGANDWQPADHAEWDQVWEQMSASTPLVHLTWKDPSCGCCALDDPAVLAFDDPRGPDWFELLYPTFMPTQIYRLG